MRVKIGNKWYSPSTDIIVVEFSPEDTAMLRGAPPHQLHRMGFFPDSMNLTNEEKQAHIADGLRRN